MVPVMFAIQHHDSIGSTNDEARRLALLGAEHGTVVHADEQTAGRGRRERAWFSPPGNLYMSVLLRLDAPLRRLSELSFLTALAVADTVDSLLPKQTRATLKWPNDVLVNGGKIAGILLEQVEDATIIGTGVNVLLAPPNVAYQTTTLAASGGIASIDEARDILLQRLEVHLAVWQEHGFPPIREAWMARGHPLGTPLRAGIGSNPIEGKFAGLDDDGALLLDTPEGRKRVIAGDVGTPTV
jgi:BirA family biotin operon repressor/biotin-[acetyl-CoA-carboxylase] ligase